MGVGKGTVARAVAKHSKYMCLDTDDMIESMQNTSVKKIFKDYGEAYFRSLEKDIAQWLQTSVTNTLISTGGGFYKVEDLKKIGLVVLLDSPFEKILQRIQEHPNAVNKLKKRPLLQDLTAAKALYEQRRPEYLALADIVIDVTNKDEDICAKELLEKVAKYV